MSNVLLFVDFWNFQLNWRDNMIPAKGESRVSLDWQKLPTVLMSELPIIMGSAGDYTYKGTRIYASVNPSGEDAKLKNFLHNVLGQMPGFRVTVKDRKNKTTNCPHCKEKIQRTVEKGVDTAIATDLFEGAINDSYDIAFLLSADADHVPAIQTIQDRLNKQIIFAGFRNGSHHVRIACWSHLLIDGGVSEKLRRVESTE